MNAHQDPTLRLCREQMEVLYRATDSATLVVRRPGHSGGDIVLSNDDLREAGNTLLKRHQALVTPPEQKPKPLSIRSRVFIPSEEHPGCHQLHRMATPDELSGEVQRVLKELPFQDSHAFDYMHWCAVDYVHGRHTPLTANADFDVAVGLGRNEGYLIRIGYWSDKEYFSVLCLKYLSDEDDVWHTARQLSKALIAGYYV